MNATRRSALALLLVLAPAAARAQAIPDHPDKLTFKPLAFEPPRARDHRVVLKNGMVVYIAEDRALPLVNIGLTVRVGRYLEPAGKEGLAGLTGMQIRRGGTRRLAAEAMDERLEFLAAQASSGISDTSGGAGLNCLKDNLDEALGLFVEMLKEPRFQEDRLALAKEQALQDMKKRNDDAENIEGREWGALVYGEGHFTNRFTTEASIRSITRDDLVAFHRKWYHPANMVAAVSGSFTRAEMIQKLEKAFAAWPTPVPQVPPVPATIAPAAAGLYRLQKDVNQGRVSMGLPTVKQDSPDIYALEVMNEILGGSGFGSRITRTVRSNEGLAYSAGSGIGFGVYYPGRFRAGFQSKSRSVAYATELVLGEIRKMRETPVTAQELDVVKSNLITTFPSSFGSVAQSMSVFASDEVTHRDPTFWVTYRDRIRAVTAAEVQRVAREYLVPEKLILIVVGDQKEIDKGDGTHDAVLAKLAPGGKDVTLALRNPMTMKR
ncbi:MAG TPA: pitrilysin family protein [Vicinamibacteria bacterium]|nr:pitrilysin family protein [Vicinamibacteria bacterium]